MTGFEEDRRRRGDAVSPQGMSPYATGGGGVTFERKVAAKYLAHMLVADGAPELGDGRRVVSVAFQQFPAHPADDLVVRAASPHESESSLVLAIAVRRAPNLVLSDESTRKLFRGLLRIFLNPPTSGPEYRFALVAAGPQRHAQQLAKLTDLAAVQKESHGFFELVHSLGTFDADVRGRLNQIEQLVERSLQDLGVVDSDAAVVRRRTWQLLARLKVCMPRLESPDEIDWSTVANSLIPFARSNDLAGALQLRDRFAALASEYSPKSAHVDLTMLRRDVHTLIDSTKRHHEHGWRILDHLHRGALTSVRSDIASRDGTRQVRLDRSAATVELVKVTTDADAVVVSGESGVGKSSLAFLSLANTEAADDSQVLCINLRQIPKLSVEFETTLGSPLPSLLGELSASRRLLLVDGAETVVDGAEEAFRHLVHAAHKADVHVVAVTSVDGKQVVQDILAECYGDGVAEYAVAPLSDTEIAGIVETFPELRNLTTNPQSRMLLRRLVVIDLLVRGQVSGVPLTDADAMREVWSGLVRRPTLPDRGSPDAREFALLRLAELDLMGGNRLDVMSNIDAVALEGLRRDGLLRTSPDHPFVIGPEFAHDEVRRYAVARLWLADQDPAPKIEAAGAPRWSLAAARLACQELLAAPDSPGALLRGRFAALQGSFDRLVEADHGARWGDVPSEALLTLPNPGAILKDAWPSLVADKDAGVRRIARLVDQRLRDHRGIVDLVAVDPIIALLLEDGTPWRSGDHTEGLLRSWLRAHVVASTPSGNPLRVLLRDQLVEACAAADRRLVKEQAAADAARAARTPEEVERERKFEEEHARIFADAGYGRRSRRRRPAVPREITDEIVLELLALLGPDLGHEGEVILRRVARDAPAWLFPAVDDLFVGRALAAFGRGLLGHLVEAYYVDAEADGYDPYSYNFGIRAHRKRSFWGPHAAWHLGPFTSLFNADFRNGVAVTNRLLNHAALVRARILAGASRSDRPPEDVNISAYQTELGITGRRQTYIGDEHVWLWYRGTGVGPYPCFSALQALELVCDRLVDSGVPLRNLVQVLLDGCENIAMVSLVVGLLVRHLEQADELLDPYLTEPLIWHLEFRRVVDENSMLAVDSEGLKALDRRRWSLREAGMSMVLRANSARASVLRDLGDTLVRNARRDMQEAHEDQPMKSESEIKAETEQELVHVRAWASVLDRNRYEARELENGVQIQAMPPKDVQQSLQESNEDMRRGHEAIRLVGRYSRRYGEGPAEATGPEDLAADVAMARSLLEDPPALMIHNPWDAATLVCAAALEAQLRAGMHLPDDALTFAANTVLRVAEGEVWPRPYEFEETCSDLAADRSAARALPLLLLPSAAWLSAAVDERDAQTVTERITSAGVNLTRAVANEVRLHLARGLDRVWETRCAPEGLCHHDVALLFATETMRDCILGRWAPDTGRRSILLLEEPYIESLAEADRDSVLPFRLDGAIRALAPAATANICVSARARASLSVLLSAQRGSLLRQEGYDVDPRGSRTLVSARALLTLAQNGDATGIFEYIGASAGSSALLGTFLRSLSAAAEETPEQAATAERIWPSVVRHVLELSDSGSTPFRGRHYGKMALAALIPNPAPDWHYLHREVQNDPIKWWNPHSLQPEVDAWLVSAAGIATCVDQLIGFLGVLSPKEQVRVGLPWIRALVLPNPDRIAVGSFMISTWLIEKRSAAVDTNLVPDWQEVVDALVVAGVTRLAPYSD